MVLTQQELNTLTQRRFGMADNEAHKLELHTERNVMVGVLKAFLGFWGECSCGEKSSMCTTSGMVHGWHARHKEDAENG